MYHADMCCSWGVDESMKTLEVLDQVGHWHCIEAADEVEAHITKFAESVQV